MRNSRIQWVAILTAVAFAIRGVIAFRGGIWADEGFFMALVETESWREMISFLHYHESHPPLFYALMRAWVAVVGHSDTAALLMPIIIGAALVPATYFVGSALFSERVALFASALAAVSSGLVEYSAQLRPYGLLPLLGLFSCFYLVRVVEKGGWKYVLAYVVMTSMMVYTHNWVWLVVAAQFGSVAAIAAGRARAERMRVVKDFATACALIALAFLPWLPAFVYQANHSGHHVVVGSAWTDVVQLVVLALVSAPSMMLLGTLPKDGIAMVTAGAIVAAAGALACAWLSRRGWRSVERVANRTAVRMFLMISLAVVVMAGALSPISYLLLGRCFIMLSPLLFLVFGSWVERVWSTEGGLPSVIPLSGALVGFTLAAFGFGLYWVLQAPRSNTRDVAAVLSEHVQPTDLLVIAPEWYAPAFNRYFKSGIEQIDYPYRGRAGLTDFSNVYARVADPAPIAWTIERMRTAKVAGRRMWLIVGPKHFRTVTDKEVEDAVKYQDPDPMILLRVNQLRRAAIASYGEPDMSLSDTIPMSRYNHLVLQLFTPVDSGSSR